MKNGVFFGKGYDGNAEKESMEQKLEEMEQKKELEQQLDLKLIQRYLLKQLFITMILCIKDFKKYVF